jgi:hypothetical protein
MAERPPLRLNLDEGAFTAQAKAAGMSVTEFADKVLAPGSKFSTKTKRRAAFTRAAKKWKH